MGVLAPYRHRSHLVAASATTLQFAADPATLAADPIKLWALSGRQASLTAHPTAATVSGSAGTKYAYAALAAPIGAPYSTGSSPQGVLYKILTLFNRADLAAALQYLHPGDGSAAIAAQQSAVTLVVTTSPTAPDSHHVPLATVEWDGAAITSVRNREGDVSIAVSALIHGQCRLTKSGANLILLPVNGQSLVINGTARAVPSAGVTLAPTGLSIDTLYYVYAAWSGSAITLEASTTGHATHTDGVEIKSGDPTRTLVGMAYVVTGPAFSDSDTQRYVASWFHRRAQRALGVFTANQAKTNTGAFEEVHSSIRASVITWGDELVRMAGVGFIADGGGNQTATALGVDGVTPEDGAQRQTITSGSEGAISVMAARRLAEGQHYVTLLGRRSAAGTSTWAGNASAPNRCAVYVEVRQ
jgi:hypothetical protein